MGVASCHFSCYHGNIITMVMGIAYRMYVRMYVCTTLPGDVLVMVCATAEVTPNTYISTSGVRISCCCGIIFLLLPSCEWWVGSFV